MSIVIVPEHVHEAIKAALEKELALYPPGHAAYKKLYGQLLEYYNEHGKIPEFTIVSSYIDRAC